MNNLNNNDVNILDLPNEILSIIFQKLNIIDVLYSLVDVNQRFDRSALDPLHIRDLNMTNIMTNNSLYNQTYLIDTQVLSRICDNILSRIHDQVHKLTIEQYSMKQILVAGTYPQLYSLSLLNFQKEILYQYLTDDSILRDLLAKQITHVNIDIDPITEESSETVSKIFALILLLCENLTVLNFCDMFFTRKYQIPFFYLPSTSYMSSTLIKLKINVSTIVDCLYLLDGRLDSLSTLIINVVQIFEPINGIGARKKLHKLKCFSFTSFRLTCNYDDIIVPLLCRMINLEELQLYLLVLRDDSYIDGIQLYDQFLIYMTQLKKFTFSIDTEILNGNLLAGLPSNEDIQRSFIGKGYQQVASCILTNSMTTDTKCHIYSLPYEFDYFIDLDNSFQGGMFHKVRYLTMIDIYPFKHKLFQLISHDFPFLEFLSITNCDPIEGMQNSSTLITFSYLTFLDLRSAYFDYVELFLLKKNAHLPRLLNLCIQYMSLTTITDDFTADVTHFNFETLKSLDVRQPFVRPKNFHHYFPLL